ncbi:MAG: hypothetical protein ACE5KX_08115 [Acidimicrobiia bacterium]
MDTRNVWGLARRFKGYVSLPLAARRLPYGAALLAADGWRPAF